MALTREDPRRHARRAALLAALDHPERRFPAVHVAGTNGKGSVAAMVSRGLVLAGRHVGTFTSPDLAGPHERLAIDGVHIAPAALAALEARVAPAIAAAEAQFPELEPMGAFERWCAAAWVWFAEAGVQVAVVEVGIGGRHDATNALPNRVMALITSIGMDHADRLGPTLADIVREKAGILRADVPAFTSARRPALTMLRAEASAMGVNLHTIPPLVGEELPGGGWRVQLPEPTILALSGRHQLENAALAVWALGVMGVRPDVISQALATVTWPGRMERVADTDGGTWLLDGAHNLPAAEALTASWGDPMVVVAGFQAGKDAAAMVPTLTAGGRPLIAVAVPGALATWEPEALRPFACGPFHVARDVPEALGMARAIARGGLRAVAGSLYLVGAVRAHLGACLPFAHEGAS
ncbi:MAG: FolC bifunctional protein [Cyanobacteria bacterium RYN_339]|nr:FolC bifunctional protein [Cyanobacteria bacterium RYN_339]